MAYEINVKNHQPADGRQIMVHHHGPNEKYTLDGTGDNSEKLITFSPSEEDSLTIQFVPLGPPDNPIPKDYEYYIELPEENTECDFTPNGDYTSGGHPGISVKRVFDVDEGKYRTRVIIPEAQVPTWSLEVTVPAGALHTLSPDDNVTVSEDAG